MTGWNPIIDFFITGHRINGLLSHNLSFSSDINWQRKIPTSWDKHKCKKQLGVGKILGHEQGHRARKWVVSVMFSEYLSGSICWSSFRLQIEIILYSMNLFRCFIVTKSSSIIEKPQCCRWNTLYNRHITTHRYHKQQCQHTFKSTCKTKQKCLLFVWFKAQCKCLPRDCLQLCRMSCKPRTPVHNVQRCMDTGTGMCTCHALQSTVLLLYHVC